MKGHKYPIICNIIALVSSALAADCAETIASRVEQLRNAPALCGDGCRWYHEAWPVLRHLGMVSTPEWHIDFYRKKLERVLAEAGDGPVRILVPATADATVVQLINEAVSNEQQTTIVVADRCQTPGRTCESLTLRSNVALQSRPTDALRTIEKFGTSRFDLIVTDAFLTRFNAGERELLLRQWWDLLKDGGHILTTIRIGNNEGGYNSHVNRQQKIESFVERAVDRANELGHRADPVLAHVNLGNLPEMLRTYAWKMESWSISLSEMQKLFQRFERVSLEVAWVPGELERSRYARVLLRKKSGSFQNCRFSR